MLSLSLLFNAHFFSPVQEGEARENHAVAPFNLVMVMVIAVMAAGVQVLCTFHKTHHEVLVYLQIGDTTHSIVSTHLKHYGNKWTNR